MALQIPVHGLGDAGFERFQRSPAEFLGPSCGVNGVAPVVAGPVGDETDQPFVRRVFRAALIQQRANLFDNVDIRPFIAAADVVGLAQPAPADHRLDAPAMILDIEPVADVAAVAVDRNRLLPQAGADHRRDELFAVLERAVVVGAVGGDHRQAVGMEIGPHQMIGTGLGGGVGRVGGVGRGFGEGRIVALQRAVDLIGRNMMEPAMFRLFSRPARPCAPLPAG